MKHKPRTIAFFQAAALTAYVTAFGLAVQYLQAFVGARNIHPNPVASIVIFLLAFITSALICSSIALAYPIWRFSSGSREEAIKIVLWTAGWLTVFFAAIGLFMLTI